MERIEHEIRAVLFRFIQVGEGVQNDVFHDLFVFDLLGLFETGVYKKYEKHMKIVNKFANTRQDYNQGRRAQLMFELFELAPVKRGRK